MGAIQSLQAPPTETIAVDELGGSFRGELRLPTSPGYDTARRIWNGVIDRHPACIARCRGTADVAAAVRFARDRDLQIALAREAHRRDDIGHARAAGDAGRTAVDRSVPEPAGGVVAGAGREQQLSAERSAELLQRAGIQRRCLRYLPCLDGGHLALQRCR